MAEPKIVVEHREHLWYLLAEATQLEHMIMCQYLYAAFSLKRDPAEGLTAEQAAATGRWRQVLHDIAIEEMLHLALVCNVMSAIGAAPTFSRPNFPQRSAYFPPSVQLDLLPFGADCADPFPLPGTAGGDGADGRGRVRARPRRRTGPVEPGEVMPRTQDFLTVGHLYRAIEQGLRDLAARLGERALFVGPPRAQATPEMFRWPDLIAVTDLASAQQAIDDHHRAGRGRPRRLAGRALRPVPRHLGRVLPAGRGRPGVRAGPAGAGRVHPAAVRPHRRAAADQRPGDPPGGPAVRARVRGAAPGADPVFHPHRRDRRSARPAHRGGVQPDERGAGAARGRAHPAARPGRTTRAARSGRPSRCST